MYCKYCGKEIQETDVFCSSCGKRIDMQDVAAARPQQNSKKNSTWLIALTISVMVFTSVCSIVCQPC